MGEVNEAVLIVVADDEADIRRLTVFTLRRRGFVVLEAASGDTALAMIQAERPDLAVLDVMMPGLTGLEVARAMRDDPRTDEIPIVILSAKGQASEIQDGLLSGATEYLLKPFSPKDLGERVMTILANRRPSTELASAPYG